MKAMFQKILESLKSELQSISTISKASIIPEVNKETDNSKIEQKKLYFKNLDCIEGNVVKQRQIYYIEIANKRE